MIIGIIGPKDSITKIYSEQSELPDHVELKTYEAHSLQDAINIADQCQSEVDGILFSGQSVRGAVVSKKNIYKPNLYVPHSAFSLLSLIFNQVESRFKNISLDVVSDKVLSEIPIEVDNYQFNTLSYEVYHTEQDYIDFHENNLQNGAQAVITTFASIYTYFSLKGTPVYRLYTTNFDINYSLRLLILEIEKKAFSDAQIGVQIIHLKQGIQEIKYEFDKKRLSFEQRLNDYVRQCSGTMVCQNKDQYYVYSTMKALNSEEILAEFFLIVEESPFTLYSGIGFGNSVFQAELNAQNALSSAENEAYANVYICDNQLQLKGPFTEASASINEPMIDKELLEKISGDIGLSTDYIKRIHRVIKTKNVNTFTAKEFAHYLNISERSANRVLKKLTDGGYGKIVDTVKANKSGRPFNVIKILL